MEFNEKHLSLLPAEWLSWPKKIEVAFTLTPWACVYSGLYDEYAVSGISGLAAKLFEAWRDGVHVRYRVRAKGFAPAYALYSVSPLLRKSSAASFEPRSRICVGAPWDFEVDDALFEVWVRPPERPGGREVLMLSAGGRDEVSAEVNWKKCAEAFRVYMNEWKSAVAR